MNNCYKNKYIIENIRRIENEKKKSGNNFMESTINSLMFTYQKKNGQVRGPNRPIAIYQ